MESIIKLNNISFSYPNGECALNAVHLNLPKGKKIALLGGNGAGKSTLMLLLNGILKPTNGYLEYENIKYSYNKKGLRALRSKIGLLFSDSDYQLIAPTVYEEISFGLLNQFNNEVLVRKKVAEIVEEFSLQDLINKPPHQLSTGQKKRVCLAAILAMEPDLIVCDEPAANLDPFFANVIFNNLEVLNKKGKTILISTHDVNQAYSWADYVVILNKGEVLGCGLPEIIFNKKEVLRAAHLNQPFIIDVLNNLEFNFEGNLLPKNINDLKKILNNNFNNKE